MSDNPYQSPVILAEVADADAAKRSDYGPLAMTAAGFFVGLIISAPAGALQSAASWMIAAATIGFSGAPVANGPFWSVQDFIGNCFAAVFVGAMAGCVWGVLVGPALGLAAGFATDRSRRRLRSFSVWMFAMGHFLSGGVVACVCAMEAGIEERSDLLWFAIGGILGATVGVVCGRIVGVMLGNVAWGRLKKS